jgi:hypothetical protein
MTLLERAEQIRDETIKRANTPLRVGGFLVDIVGKFADYTPTSNLAISNWNTAFGWGNHAGLYDALGAASAAVSGHETTYNHGNFVVTTDSRLSDSRPASDVYAWAKAETKPAYTHTEVGAAPTSHTHTKANITDFAHTHTKSEITDFAHNHAWADITSGVPATATRWPTYTEVTDKPSTFAPSAHTLHSHSASTLAQLNGIISDAILIDTGDSRLSDARIASDVYAWAKAATKPTYTAAEVSALASNHAASGVTTQKITDWDGAVTHAGITTGNNFHGASIVGANMLRVGSPSAIRYLKINANNSITLRTAEELVADLGISASDSYTKGETDALVEKAQNEIRGTSNFTSSFTLNINQAGFYIRSTTTGARTVTVPNTTSVAFPVGTVITFRQASTGQITLAPASGVTLNGDRKTAAQHKSIQITHVSNNVWDIEGGVP